MSLTDKNEKSDIETTSLRKKFDLAMNGNAHFGKSIIGVAAFLAMGAVGFTTSAALQNGKDLTEIKATRFTAMAAAELRAEMTKEHTRMQKEIVEGFQKLKDCFIRIQYGEECEK